MRVKEDPVQRLRRVNDRRAMAYFQCCTSDVRGDVAVTSHFHS